MVCLFELIMIVLGVCGPDAFKSDIDFKRSKTFFSVAASKALVESSRARIGESFKMARANEIRCFCPPDSVMPLSPIIVSRPCSNRSKSSTAEAKYRA
ncbi:hypothetical protein D3C73_1330680 [compost metagenome]